LVTSQTGREDNNNNDNNNNVIERQINDRPTGTNYYNNIIIYDIVHYTVHNTYNIITTIDLQHVMSLRRQRRQQPPIETISTATQIDTTPSN